VTDRPKPSKPDVLATTRIFLSDSNTLAALRLLGAITRLYGEHGLPLTTLEDVREGSVWLTFRTWFTRQATKEDNQRFVKEVAAELRTWGEQRSLGISQAQIDEKNSKSVSEVVAQMNEYDNAAVHIGSLLILKRTVNGARDLVVHTLTARQLATLNQYPELIGNPATILDQLSILGNDRIPDDPSEMDTIIIPE